MVNTWNTAELNDKVNNLIEKVNKIDAKTLPDTSEATTGQILGLTGEDKTPEWVDVSGLLPDYSTTETATGKKWIDGKDIYCRVINGTFPEITSTGTQPIATDHTIENIIATDLCLFQEGAIYPRPTQTIIYVIASGVLGIASVTTGFSEQPYICVLYYTKKDPTPGRAPEDSDQEPEPEEKKTTKKKTTK